MPKLDTLHIQIIAGLFGAALFFAGAMLGGVGQASKTEQNATAQSSGALLGGPFEMVNQSGETVTEASYADHYLFIYFGFTFCPDICPAALESMSVALDQLGAKGANVKPLFVTVDPERDTVENVREYVANFHEDFDGLTGTAEQVRSMADVYKVYYRKNITDLGQDGYLMDHSGYIYFMDPAGTYLTHFTHRDSPDQMAVKMAEYLR